jgi:hypothetical protein
MHHCAPHLLGHTRSQSLPHKLLHLTARRSAPRPQNFVVNAAQAQLNGQLVRPDGSLTDAGRLLDGLDIGFTCVFALELAMNAYAHWLAPFLRSGYNLVDTVVVLLSLLALGPINVPISILRVVRAFRVVRIFGRLRSLKNIITGLAASVAPVFNAFLLMLLVVSICEQWRSVSRRGDLPLCRDGEWRAS